MAMTPEQEARYALGYGVARSDLSLAAQLEYDRLVAGQVPSPEGQRPQTKEERKEGHRQARQERREETRRRWQERQERAAATTWFPNLGVAVHEGQVYQHGAKQSGMASDMQARNERTLGMTTKLLGSLTGAHAEVGGGKGGHRRSGNARVADAALATAVVGPLGLLAGASRTGYRGFAVVAFADGSAWEKSFTDSASLIKAQSEALRFNSLGASAKASDVPQDGGVAAELERLAALRASGMLDDEEFRAAKARIIHGG
jgi:Short C-terminal domain